jgi:hypothetical protein
MSLALATVRPAAPAPIGNPLVPRSMGEALQLAEMMSRSKVGIPEHLRGSPGDCLMVIEVATRWNMSPFAVAQCTNKVKDKLGYEGKIIHAAIESSGVVDGYVDYEFSGAGDARSIRVFATRRGEAEPRDVIVKLTDAKTTNEWWRKTPDQMLVYHGARVWARRWTPGVLLGVYAPEEFDATPREPTHAGPAIEGEKPIELTAQPAPKPRTALEKFSDRIAALPDRAACFAFMDDPAVKAAYDKRPQHERETIMQMLADKADTFPTPAAPPADAAAKVDPIDDEIPF